MSPFEKSLEALLRQYVDASKVATARKRVQWLIKHFEDDPDSKALEYPPLPK